MNDIEQGCLAAFLFWRVDGKAGRSGEAVHKVAVYHPQSYRMNGGIRHEYIIPHRRCDLIKELGSVNRIGPERGLSEFQLTALHVAGRRAPSLRPHQLIERADSDAKFLGFLFPPPVVFERRELGQINQLVLVENSAVQFLIGLVLGVCHSATPIGGSPTRSSAPMSYSISIAFSGGTRPARTPSPTVSTSIKSNRTRSDAHRSCASTNSRCSLLRGSARWSTFNIAKYLYGPASGVTRCCRAIFGVYGETANHDAACCWSASI